MASGKGACVRADRGHCEIITTILVCQCFDMKVGCVRDGHRFHSHVRNQRRTCDDLRPSKVGEASPKGSYSELCGQQHNSGMTSFRLWPAEGHDWPLPRRAFARRYAEVRIIKAFQSQSCPAPCGAPDICRLKA
jgi:hypothetical protein